MRTRTLRYRSPKAIEDMTPNEVARAVLRFKYEDGTRLDLPVAEYLATIDRQRLALRGIRAKLRAVASRTNGRRGGRPVTTGRPSDAEILTRFGALWLKYGNRREYRQRFLSARARAKAQLVKEIAGERGVTERVVRAWVKAAIG